MNALALLVMDREAEARALFEVGVAQLRSHRMDHQWLAASSVAAELAARFGSKADAQWLYHRLQPFAGQLCVPGAGPPIFIRGATDLWLGVVATMLGEPGAGAHHEKAVAIHDRLGARPFSALSRLEYARHLAACGRHRDALEPASPALKVASALGMAPLAGDARALVASLQSAVEPSPLSRRETEIAEHVAKGLTNKQIATALFLSERTVESHVQNILGKLGFRTRSQIATWVISDAKSG
jgi:DNA-binding CsgD family transcriptional regulator